MNPTPLRSWPPLITGARLPRWIRIRDVVLTLLAWFLLGRLLRDPIYVAYDYLRHPIFQLTTAQPLDIRALWERLRYFALISVVLVTWLCLWALINRRRLIRCPTHAPQPPELSLAEQAARAGIDEKKVNEAREFKVTNVHFREDGAIAGFEELPAGKADSVLAGSAPPSTARS
jgi:poly-beta-1,6-N-acetyl-D-glucosamine biosynthesis protein PgaD